MPKVDKAWGKLAKHKEPAKPKWLVRVTDVALNAGNSFRCYFRQYEWHLREILLEGALHDMYEACANEPESERAYKSISDVFRHMRTLVSVPVETARYKDTAQRDNTKSREAYMDFVKYMIKKMRRWHWVLRAWEGELKRGY